MTEKNYIKKTLRIGKVCEKGIYPRSFEYSKTECKDNCDMYHVCETLNRCKKKD